MDISTRALDKVCTKMAFYFTDIASRSVFYYLFQYHSFLTTMHSKAYILHVYKPNNKCQLDRVNIQLRAVKDEKIDQASVSSSFLDR